jgi:hypothetical protein
VKQLDGYQNFHSAKRRQASTVLAAISLRRSLLVDAEMLLDMRDADFKLEALVDFVLLELAQLFRARITTAGSIKEPVP